MRSPPPPRPLASAPPRTQRHGRQAVSWARAAQDGVWVVSGSERPDPADQLAYDYEFRLPSSVAQRRAGLDEPVLLRAGAAPAQSGLGGSPYRYRAGIRGILRHLPLGQPNQSGRPGASRNARPAPLVRRAAIAAGLSLAETAALARHANARVTAQVYAGLPTTATRWRRRRPSTAGSGWNRSRRGRGPTGGRRFCSEGLIFGTRGF